MPHPFSRHRFWLHAGSAAAALMFTAPALAQSLDPGAAATVASHISPDEIAISARDSLGNDQVSTTPASASTAMGAVLASGDLKDDAIAVDATPASASVAANAADNRLEIDGDAGSQGTSPLAVLANRQQLGSQQLGAHAAGGVALSIDGEVQDSHISTSRNRVTTEATGNLARANSLTASGAVLEGGPAIAAVRIGPDGSGTSDAGLVLHNVQDSGTAHITALQDAGAVHMMLYGGTGNMSIAAADNVQAGTATANDAANAIEIDAAGLTGTAALASFQSGNGMVEVALGSVGDGIHSAGVTIAPQATLDHATIAITGNTVTGFAIANRASNALSARAAAVAGTGAATAGLPGSDHGATGALALVNAQEFGALGAEGQPPATVSGEVAGRFGVDGDFDAPGSVLTVTGNTQQAIAVANSATSDIAATRADRGVALASDQYGQAAVTAVADLKLPGKASGGEVTTDISDNANSALAVMNDAANSIAAGATASGVGAATASAGDLAAPVATGQVALASQQFAIGSVTASAVGRAFPSDPGGDLEASRLRMSNNSSDAEAAANRAANRVSASGNVALVNGQTSHASVSANAVMSDTASLDAIARGAAITITGNGASSLAHGNAADNALVLTGPDALPETARTTFAADEAEAAGADIIVNIQTNSGAVRAIAASPLPLNLGDAGAGTVSAGATSLDAAAYGNLVSNSASGPVAQGGIALASRQVNLGAVDARAAGSLIAASSASGTDLAFGGNRISATAIGNQAVNLVTLGR